MVHSRRKLEHFQKTVVHRKVFLLGHEKRQSAKVDLLVDWYGGMELAGHNGVAAQGACRDNVTHQTLSIRGG